MILNAIIVTLTLGAALVVLARANGPVSRS